MSDESWQTTLLIAFGCLLGVTAGGLILPAILPIKVGDGWGSAIGALIGVVGAFLAARASFVWNEKARKREMRTPISRRQQDSIELLDECLSLLNEVEKPLACFAEKALVECENLQKLVSISLPEFSKYHETYAKQTEQISAYKAGMKEATVAAAQKVKIDNIDGIRRRLLDIVEALDWVLSEMVNVMTPPQIRLIKSAREYVLVASGCTSLISNVM